MLCTGLGASAFAGETPYDDPNDFLPYDAKQAALGQLLFYDKILSGNKNIACSTCHHPDFGTGDGLSLGIGEGGVGLGTNRHAGTGDSRIKKRIPRNAPALWNLGAKDINVMFHDGRLSFSDVYGNGLDSPAQEWLPEGFTSILAAQAIFPLVAQFEMAGNPSENEIAGAVHDRIDAAWPILAKRVRVIPEYGQRFVDAYRHIQTPEQVTIADIGNALASFISFEWRSMDSPFDAYLMGDETAMIPDQIAGMELFMGRGNCASCHVEPLFSDQKFYALGLPAFGPGRTRTFDFIARDVGKMGHSDDLADAYRFRTPMLRNVALTAPYGHNGAYPDLRGIIEHHLNPEKSRANWHPDLAALPDAPWLAEIDFIVQQDTREMARQARAIDIKPVDLDDMEIDQLIAFMHALTSDTRQRLGIPNSVPSGLPLD
ncbi:cytochrome-c peroxidase [Paramylibacter ulvae]|uniref:cytochrome-c peroxidase n=1 Tax=Paramylibacter ulvae TaxID=1651968 RepID=UPI001E5147A3|nr:cytochrome c peroxidase [Amylibacter ulvae]